MSTTADRSTTDPGAHPRREDDPERAERAHAADLVQEVLRRWETSLGHGSHGRLRDRAVQAMGDEASQRLRQVLTQIGTQLELAAHGCKVHDDAGPFLDRFPEMMRTLARAASVLDVYMEHHEAYKLMLDLDLQPFDLAQRLTQRLEAADAFLAQVPVHAELEACFVEGDPFKLLDVLMDLISRFQEAGRPGDVVLVRLTADGPWLHGFIGLDPHRAPADHLVEELVDPLSVDGPTIDSLYARAVLERHGGSLMVEGLDEGPSGFGFRLPLITGTEDG